MGDKDSGIILGIIIGAIIAIVLLGRNTQQTQVQSAHSQQTKQYQQSQEQAWKPMDIPRVDDIKPVYQQPMVQIHQDPRLTQVMSELERTNSQLEQATSKLQELEKTKSKIQELENSISKLKAQSIQSIPQRQAVIQPETISELEQTTSRLMETVSKLEKNNDAHLQTISKLQETVSRLEHDNNKFQTQIELATKDPQTVQISHIPETLQLPQYHTGQTQQIYKNNEKWLIKRGPNGRLKSLEIARDVEKKS